MTINIPLQVTTGGVAQAASDFEAIRKAIAQTAKESSGITALASSLGATYKEAKQLSQSLGLTAEATSQAVGILRQLSSVGADAATKFQVLQGKMGLTVDQFEALNAAVSGQKDSIAQVVAGYSSLARTLGKSYDEAEAFAKGLGLTAQQAQQAVGQLKEMNAVGVSTATRHQVLEQTLGLTVDQFDKLEAAAKGTSGALQQSEKSASGFDNVLMGIGQAGFGILANTLAGLPGQIAGPTLQFEKFKTVLNTLYGDTAKADEAFSRIQNFAATTPFQLDEVVGSFIKLKNRGIDPTNETLKNLGDIALSQGKSLDQMTEALLDATTGEFERLKEFGIQASSAGDKVTFTFKGVTKTVEKTPEAIQGAIQEFGKLQGVAGGMEAQSKTLGGALSNLQDNVTKIAVAFGEELIPVLVEFVNGAMGATGSLEDFARNAGKQTAEVLKAIASALKFVNENANYFQALLAVLVARVAALKAIALYQTLLQWAAGFAAATAAETAGVAADAAAAGGKVTLAAATQGARIALQQFIATAIAAAPAILALGAAVGLISFYKLIADMKKANDEFDAVAESSSQLSNAFGSVAGKVQGLNNVYKANGKFTAEEQKLAAIRVAAGKDMIKSLDEQLARAKAIVPANEEQKNAQTALVASLERQKSALSAQTEELEKNLAASQKRAKGIENEADAQKALKKVEEGLKSKTLDEEAALKQLEVIKNSTKAGKEAQQEAADAIIKIKKDQTDGEIAILEGSRAKIEAAVRAGTLSEAAAEQQLTAIKQTEVQKRLALINQELAGAKGSEKDKLLGEKKKLEAELTSVQADAQAKRNQELIRNFDEQRSILEGQYAQGKVSQQQYNQQILQIDLAKNDEELRQLQEQLRKLSATDKEGREAINAKIGDIYKKRADIIRAAYDRERRAIDEANNKALAQSKLADTQRQISIQKLLNSGAIDAKKAAQLQSESKLASISDEIAAEQAKYAKLQQLATVDAETAKQKDRDIAASQQRLAELTLARLQEQRNAEQRLREAAIAGIQQRQKLEQAATREAVLGVQQKVAVLERERAAQEAIGRSLEREGKLITANMELQRAQLSAESNRYDAQIAGISKAIDLIKQYNQESDPKKKDQQGQLLSALGISTGQKELDLIKQRQAIEDRQAIAKERQRQAEQLFARQQLEINLKKAELEARMQLIAAKRGEFEAKITEQKAKQALSDAKAELAQAKLIQDPAERAAAVAAAQVGVKEAQQGLTDAVEQKKLAAEQRRAAEQNIKDVADIGDKQKQALDIQQRSENAIAAQGEGMRQLNQTLELSQQGAEGFAAALEKAASASQAIQSALGGAAIPQPRFAGGDIRPGVPYTIAERGPEAIRYPDGSYDYILNPVLMIPQRRGHVLTASETASLLSSRPASPFAMSANAVNQMATTAASGPMLQELKALRHQVEEMRPIQERNIFNIHSKEVIQEAADLHLKIARNRLRRSKRG